FLAECSADIAVIKDGVVGRLRGVALERIPGIKSGIVAADHELAMQFVGTGLGENFDAAVAELVVFGGKWILIQANFANRGFRRKLPGREAVDINLAAVGTGGRACKRGQLFLKL